MLGFMGSISSAPISSNKLILRASSASSVVTVDANGSAELVLTASGTTSAPAGCAASASLTMSCTAGVNVIVQAAGSVDLSMTGSGSAVAAINAAAIASLALSSTASAVVSIDATGEASLVLAGTAEAAVRVTAAGAASLSIAGAAASAVSVSAQGDAILVLAATGAAVVSVAAGGTGDVTDTVVISATGSCSVAVVAHGVVRFRRNAVELLTAEFTLNPIDMVEFIEEERLIAVLELEPLLSAVFYDSNTSSEVAMAEAFTIGTDFRMTRGDDRSFTVCIRNQVTGEVKDVTGHHFTFTAKRVRQDGTVSPLDTPVLRKTDEDELEIFVRTQTGDDVGLVDLFILGDDTKFERASTLQYDFQVRTPQGQTSTIARGTIELEGDISSAEDETVP